MVYNNPFVTELIHSEPTGYPPNLIVVSVEPTSITFSWEEMGCFQRNGRLVGYEVHLYYGSKFHSSEILGPNVTKYTAKRLIPFRDYGLRVAAINHVGRGDFSPTVFTRTTLIGILHAYDQVYVNTTKANICICIYMHTYFVLANSCIIMIYFGVA